MPANQPTIGGGSEATSIAPYDPSQCDYPDCCKPKRQLGLCHTHYMRLWRQRNSDPYLIAEDGIIDMIAVDIAVNGTRLVRLTQRERELAAARIIAGGGTPTTIRRHLGLVKQSAARTLATRVKAKPPAEPADEPPLNLAA